MALAYYLPKWFFSYDVILELAFAIILFLVAFLAFRIYRITGHKPTRLLGMGFLFISLSNFLESILNFLMIAKTDYGAFENLSLPLLNYLSVNSYLIFTILGLATLLYMSFKTEKTRILGFLILISLLFVFLSKDPVYYFYILATIYLIFISSFFIKAYLKNRKFDAFLIALAFVFLLMDRALFLFLFDRELSYVLGHFPELIAYLLILLNFYIIRKK